MTRKILATMVAASLALGQTAVAAAVPAYEREAAPVEQSEAAGIKTYWLVALFIALGIGIIFAVEENEDQDLPSSP